MATMPVLATDQRTQQGKMVDSDNPLPVTPTAAAGLAPNNASTTAYANNLLVKNSAGTLYGIGGHNSGPVQFLQLFDASSIPGAGSVPVGPVVRIPATDNFSIDFGGYGMKFNNGIIIANSTTGPTRTAGAADTWIAARFL